MTERRFPPAWPIFDDDAFRRLLEPSENELSQPR